LTNNQSATEHILQFINNENNAVLHEIQVNAGEKIEYSYIHSSDGTPVKQIFTLTQDGTLKLLEERYSWQGAGLETGADKEITVEDGEVRVTGYDRKFSELTLRVARTVPQNIVTQRESLKLSDIAPGGTSITIKTNAK